MSLIDSQTEVAWLCGLFPNEDRETTCIVFICEPASLFGRLKLDTRAIAHIRKTDKKRQSLEDHLLKVAELTGQFAGKIGLSASGQLAGCVHDLGKYAEEFQRYILSANEDIDPDSDDFVDPVSNKGKIDHSTAGAQYIWKKYAYPKYKAFAQAMFLSVCSHHSGLIDCLSPDGNNRFRERLEKDVSMKKREMEIDMRVREKLEALPAEKVLKEWKARYRHIFKRELELAGREHSTKEMQQDYENAAFFKLGLLLRCFFSCLLDADRIDSACFEDSQYARLRERLGSTDWGKLIDRLETKLSGFQIQNHIHEIRQEIADACYARSEELPQGIYTLTVPTGGGKTLSSLRFALNHARKHQLDRIVFIIPYTSIIEQNARVVRDILEAGEEPGTIVLEHHSNIEPEKETWQGKLLSSNWETPVVFTTMVQFLESLFGSGTASARRMHNLCNTVLVFDEIQTIPVRCVHPFCHALNFLVEECGSTAVLCTATQPLLGNVPNPEKGQLRLAQNAELMPDLPKLFDELKRVRFIDHTQTPMNLEQVGDLAIEEQCRKGNCLVIVNTKNWALELLRYCQEKGCENVFHLSTSMCAAHRTDVRKQVEKLLLENEPVLLISTQLIECGVDISFKSVVRLAAGLDSVLQAAGRCNRNMEEETGSVHVIRVMEGKENIQRLDDIRKGRDVFLRILDEYRDRFQEKSMDLSDPEIIGRYFRYYFHERRHLMAYPCDIKGKKENMLSLLGRNSSNIGKQDEPRMLRQSFAAAAECFTAIDAETQGILVPYGEGRQIIAELCAWQPAGEASFARQKQLLRQAQRYAVNLYPDALKKLGNAITSIPDTGIRFLQETYYRNDTGVSAEATGEMEFLLY